MIQLFLLNLILNLVIAVTLTNITLLKTSSYYSYSQIVVGNSFVNIQFQVISSPNYTSTVVIASFLNITTTPSYSTYYGADPLNYSSLDLQNLWMGKKQYINLRIPVGFRTLYLNVYNLDPIDRKNDIIFNIIITYGNGRICAPCLSGLLNSKYCSCYNCASGYQGIDCSRKISYLSPSQNNNIRINSYTPKYLKIPSPNKDVILTFQSQTDNIQIYLCTINFAGEIASYVNVDVYGKPQIYVLQKQNTLMLRYPGSSSDLSITIVKLSSGQGQINVKYQIQYQTESQIIIITVIIVVSVLSSILFVIIARIIIKLILRPRVENLQNFPIEINRMTTLQTDKYFPQLKYKQYLNQIIFSENSYAQVKMEIQQKQCVICLQTIKQQDFVRLTYCKHLFHSYCLIGWFHKHLNCPYCRQDFKKNNTISFYNKLNQNMQNKPLEGIHLIRAINCENMSMQSIQLLN